MTPWVTEVVSWVPRALAGHSNALSAVDGAYMLLGSEVEENWLLAQHVYSMIYTGTEKSE